MNKLGIDDQVLKNLDEIPKANLTRDWWKKDSIVKVYTPLTLGLAILLPIEPLSETNPIFTAIQAAITIIKLSNEIDRASFTKQKSVGQKHTPELVKANLKIQAKFSEINNELNYKFFIIYSTYLHAIAISSVYGSEWIESTLEGLIGKNLPQERKNAGDTLELLETKLAAYELEHKLPAASLLTKDEKRAARIMYLQQRDDKNTLHLRDQKSAEETKLIPPLVVPPKPKESKGYFKWFCCLGRDKKSKLSQHVLPPAQLPSLADQLKAEIAKINISVENARKEYLDKNARANAYIPTVFCSSGGYAGQHRANSFLSSLQNNQNDPSTCLELFITHLTEQKYSYKGFKFNVNDGHLSFRTFVLLALRKSFIENKDLAKLFLGKTVDSSCSTQDLAELLKKALPKLKTQLSSILEMK